MKRCVFCGTENDDSATVCVRCHNQLPDRPDGEEQRLTGFSGDPAVDGDRRDASGFEPASRMPEDVAAPREQDSVKHRPVGRGGAPAFCGAVRSKRAEYSGRDFAAIR